jgi:hypothetical protein
METVFDLNPTDDELILVFGSPERIDWFRSDVDDQDTHLVFLAALMHIRKKPDREEQYLHRIQDREYRESIIQLWFGHSF